jgi:hypothetical protein
MKRFTNNILTNLSFTPTVFECMQPVGHSSCILKNKSRIYRLKTQAFSRGQVFLLKYFSNKIDVQVLRDVITSQP